jgi:hypothetical protein
VAASYQSFTKNTCQRNSQLGGKIIFSGSIPQNRDHPVLWMDRTCAAARILDRLDQGYLPV